MKIIAKYKDYYDFLQGKYGVDPKVVYDRRNGTAPYREEGTVFLIHFCGFEYYGVVLDGGGRFTNEAFKEAVGRYSRRDGRGSPYFEAFRFYPRTAGVKQGFWTSRENSKFREPVLVQRFSCGRWTEPLKPTLLSAYNFPSVKSASDAFIEISNFISGLIDNPQKPDNFTDRDKILSHGFDLKKSFRHKK